MKRGRSDGETVERSGGTPVQALARLRGADPVMPLAMATLALVAGQSMVTIWFLPRALPHHPVILFPALAAGVFLPLMGALFLAGALVATRMSPDPPTGMEVVVRVARRLDALPSRVGMLVGMLPGGIPVALTYAFGWAGLLAVPGLALAYYVLVARPKLQALKES